MNFIPGFGKKEESQQKQIEKGKAPIGDNTSEDRQGILAKAKNMMQRGGNQAESSSSRSVHAPDSSVANETAATSKAVSKFPFGKKTTSSAQVVRHKDDEITAVSQAYIDKMGQGALNLAQKEYKEAIKWVNEALSEPIPNIKEAHEKLDNFVTKLAAKTSITKEKAEEIMASTRERIEGEEKKIPMYLAQQHGEKMIKGIDEESQEIFQNGLTLLSQSAKELRGKVIDDVRKVLTPAIQEKQRTIAELQEKKERLTINIKFYQKGLLANKATMKKREQEGITEELQHFETPETIEKIRKAMNKEELEVIKINGDIQTAQDKLAQLLKMSSTLDTLADEK